MAKTYSDLLKDPRWQKKRLDILNRDHFRCRHCESPKKTLHVHHMYYIKGNLPWEYDDDCLVTLCEDCHAEVNRFDWQRAFMDLNLPPNHLLEMALQIKFSLKKEKDSWEKDRAAGGVKFNFNPTYHYSDGWVQSLKSEDDLNEYYRDFYHKEREKYLKN